VAWRNWVARQLMMRKEATSAIEIGWQGKILVVSIL